MVLIDKGHWRLMQVSTRRLYGGRRQRSWTCHIYTKVANKGLPRCANVSELHRVLGPAQNCSLVQRIGPKRGPYILTHTLLEGVSRAPFYRSIIRKQGQSCYKRVQDFGADLCTAISLSQPFLQFDASLDAGTALEPGRTPAACKPLQLMSRVSVRETRFILRDH